MLPRNVSGEKSILFRVQRPIPGAGQVQVSLRSVFRPTDHTDVRRAQRTAGTSMVEILIAVAFLGVCAVSILEAVFSANGQASYAARRNLVLIELKNEIESARGLAANGALTEGNTADARALPGIPEKVTVQRSVALQSGSRTLFDVVCRAEWKDETSDEQRDENLTLATVVFQP